MADVPSADRRGWGPPCSGRKVTITPLNMALPVRAEVAVIFQRFILEAEERGFSFNRKRDDWGYACRHIRDDPSLPWSNHAWGLAVDLDATQNPMADRLITTFPGWIDELAERYGLRWGGNFTGQFRDAMHFEFVGTPADARRITARLKGGDEMTPAQEEKLNRVLRALTVEGSTGEDQSFQFLYSNVSEVRKALVIAGTATAAEGVQKIYDRAKGADVKAVEALARADQALVKADQVLAQNAQTHAKLTELRELVEKALLAQGGGE